MLTNVKCEIGSDTDRKVTTLGQITTLTISTLPVFDNFADVFNVYVLHLKIDLSFTCNKLCFIIGNAMLVF